MKLINELNQQKRETINKVTAIVQKEIDSNNSKISELQSELTTNKNNFYESYNATVLEVQEKIYGPGGSSIGGPPLEELAPEEALALFDKLDLNERTILLNELLDNMFPVGDNPDNLMPLEKGVHKRLHDRLNQEIEKYADKFINKICSLYVV